MLSSLKVRCGGAWIAPVVLVVVACVQVYLVNFHGLTPWKGAGFGMFSSVDKPDRRSVCIQMETESGRWLVDWRGDPRIREQVVSFRNFPTSGRMDDLAHALVDRRWMKSPLGKKELVPQGEGGGESWGGFQSRRVDSLRSGSTSTGVKSLEVVVRRLEYRRRDGVLRAADLRAFSWSKR
jgi:hypothetical protein